MSHSLDEAIHDPRKVQVLTMCRFSAQGVLRAQPYILNLHGHRNPPHPSGVGAARTTGSRAGQGATVRPRIEGWLSSNVHPSLWFPVPPRCPTPCLDSKLQGFCINNRWSAFSTPLVCKATSPSLSACRLFQPPPGLQSH